LAALRVAKNWGMFSFFINFVMAVVSQIET
jgi:hypothetical protein